MMKKSTIASIAAAIVSFALCVTLIIIFTKAPHLPSAVRVSMRIVHEIVAFPLLSVARLSQGRWSQICWINTLLILTVPIFWGAVALIIGRMIERRQEAPNN